MDSSATDAAETDYDVYPTHFLDNLKSVKSLLLAWTLLFNDTLDTGKLCTSLERLLSTGDWRRLGGRLRSSRKEGPSNRYLEIHVPKTFRPGRQAFAFTQEMLQVALREHPLAAGLAVNPSEPTLGPGPYAYQQLVTSESGPKTLQDLLEPEGPPILTLHVVEFTDATLVTVTFPHLAMDGIAFSHFLQAWSHVLAGNENKVAPVMAARTDLLAIAAEGQPVTAWQMHAHLLTGLWLLLFMLRFLWDTLWDSEVESKTVFLPQRAMDVLYDQALREVNQDGPIGGKALPRISKGDVLMAWFCRNLSSAQSRPRSICAGTAMDIRSQLPSLTKSNTSEDRQAGIHVQNAVVPAYTSFSAGDLQRPLGKVALQHREALVQQRTRESITGFLAMMKQQFDGGKENSNIVVNETSDIPLLMSNRVKIDVLNHVNFSPAVIKHPVPSAEELHRPGVPVYQHSQVVQPNRLWRNIVVVTGKDHQGGYWMTGLFTAKVWRVIDRELKKVSAVTKERDLERAR